jgi:hypothetical protein
VKVEFEPSTRLTICYLSQSECDEWIYSAKLLFTDLTSDRNAYPEINLVDLARTVPGISRIGQKSRQPENANEAELSSSSIRTRQQSANMMPGQQSAPMYEQKSELYEALDDYNNTKFKSLDIINVNSNSDHMDGSKLAVFNAFKTIEKLQDKIVYAQNAMIGFEL